MKHHPVKSAVLTVVAALLVSPLLRGDQLDKGPENDLKTAVSLLTEELKALRIDIKTNRAALDSKLEQLSARLSQLEERLNQVTPGQSGTQARKAAALARATIRLAN